MAMMGGIIQGVSGKISERGQNMGQYRQEIHNKAVAEQNAALSREEAARVRREADLAEEAERRLIAEDLGRAFAAAAQSGARGGGGTTLDRMLEQSARVAELDALNIRYGGDRARTAHLTDAANYDLEAQMANKRAGAIKKNMWVPLVGGALTAAGSYGTGGGGSGFNFGAMSRNQTSYKTGGNGRRIPAYVASKGTGSRRTTIVYGGNSSGSKGGKG